MRRATNGRSSPTTAARSIAVQATAIDPARAEARRRPAMAPTPTGAIARHGVRGRRRRKARGACAPGDLGRSRSSLHPPLPIYLDIGVAGARARRRFRLRRALLEDRRARPQLGRGRVLRTGCSDRRRRRPRALLPHLPRSSASLPDASLARVATRPRRAVWTVAFSRLRPRHRRRHLPPGASALRTSCGNRRGGVSRRDAVPRDRQSPSPSRRADDVLRDDVALLPRSLRSRLAPVVALLGERVPRPGFSEQGDDSAPLRSRLRVPRALGGRPPPRPKLARGKRDPRYDHGGLPACARPERRWTNGPELPGVAAPPTTQPLLELLLRRSAEGAWACGRRLGNPLTAASVAREVLAGAPAAVLDSRPISLLRTLAREGLPVPPLDRTSGRSSRGTRARALAGAPSSPPPALVESRLRRRGRRDDGRAELGRRPARYEESSPGRVGWCSRRSGGGTVDGRSHAAWGLVLLDRAVDGQHHRALRLPQGIRLV